MPTPPPPVLSDDQTAALAALLAALRGPSREASLAGAAGTGKTTLMRALLGAWGASNVLLLAPTGKAARRLSEVTGYEAGTIHGALYGLVEEQERQNKRERTSLAFGDRKALVASLVVVDEASMVGRKLADDVRAACREGGATLLWVGDHEQLPPVKANIGVNLAAATAKLTKVHRQALESPVLDLATRIREGKGASFDRWTDADGACSRTSIRSTEDAVRWAEEAPAERILLTWTNRVRSHANALTRRLRGLAPNTLVAGERIVVTFNNHGLGMMNGETFAVSRVERCDDLSDALQREIVWVWVEGRTSPVLMCPELFDNARNEDEHEANRAVWSPIFRTAREDILPLMERAGWDWSDLKAWRGRVHGRVIEATYAYCLTVYKAQGSQYPSVGFVSCPALRGHEDKKFVKSMVYTAVTRAERQFRAFTLGASPEAEAEALPAK
jgi:exodeoxyribonuclease-5